MSESQVIESFSNEGSTTSKDSYLNSPIEDSLIESVREGFTASDLENPDKVVEKFTSGTTTVIGIILILVAVYFAYRHFSSKKVSV